MCHLCAEMHILLFAIVEKLRTLQLSAVDSVSQGSQQ